MITLPTKFNALILSYEKLYVLSISHILILSLVMYDFVHEKCDFIFLIS